MVKRWGRVNEDLEKLEEDIKIKSSESNDINYIWTTFKSQMFKILDTHIPTKVIKSNNKLPWINHKIRKMLKRKQNLYNKAKKSKQWTKYRQYQKECKREIRRSEWNYINEAILEGMKKKTRNLSGNMSNLGNRTTLEWHHSKSKAIS